MVDQLDDLTTCALYLSLLVELVLSGVILAGKPNSLAGVRFLELLSEDEMAFDNLYCVAFQMMDAQWLAKRASYMEFNVKDIPITHFVYRFRIIYVLKMTMLCQV